MDDSSKLDRRQALKVLGAIPVIGPVAFAEAQAQPAEPDQAAPRETQQQPARRFFTQRELRTVAVLADDIIPRDEHSGSATDAGVPAFIDFNLSVPETSDATRLAWRGGLRWLDRESRKRFGVPYASAREAQRHAILDDISAPDGAPELRSGTAFFTRARDMVASGFFSSVEGYKDLRYIGNVFNPDWKGCPPEALARLGVSYDLMTNRAQ